MVEPSQLKQLLSLLAQAAKDSPRLQGYLDEVESLDVVHQRPDNFNSVEAVLNIRW